MKGHLKTVIGSIFFAIAGLPLGGAAMADIRGQPHLILLAPEATRPQDIASKLDEAGFVVSRLLLEPGTLRDQARTVATQVRALVLQGVAPKDITVVGAGSGANVAILTSAALGSTAVSYVILGKCDATLKDSYRFRMAGRILNIYDNGERPASSCRMLWQHSPKAAATNTIELESGMGSALFGQPSQEWIVPLTKWARRDGA